MGTSVGENATETSVSRQSPLSSDSQTLVVKNSGGPKRFIRQQVPDSILNDPRLKEAMSVFPSNYNFEIPKSIWRLKQAKSKKVALQFPEGLLMYSLAICDILETFAEVEECFVLGDVTYGACCVDDFSATALGADFLIHYGHSCLVPIDMTLIPCLYVFVDIQIDVQHLVETVKKNFDRSCKLAVAGTIQFSTAIHAAKVVLSGEFSSIQVPQSKPLSPGEVLGCTSPALPSGSVDSLVFVADGRFHLEAFMIANPEVKAYRYDPYSKLLTIEEYDHKGMREARMNAIKEAQGAKTWGVVLGTLGRQGNPRILTHVEQRLDARKLDYNVFLISELSPTKLALFQNSVDAWIQIACPRLSIDWGEAFKQPLLTPYEAEVALGFVKPWWRISDGVAAPGAVQTEAVGTCECSRSGCSSVKSGVACRKVEGKENEESNAKDNPTIGSYPMDYYSRDGGAWNSSYVKAPQCWISAVPEDDVWSIRCGAGSLVSLWSALYYADQFKSSWIHVMRKQILTAPGNPCDTALRIGFYSTVVRFVMVEFIVLGFFCSSMSAMLIAGRNAVCYSGKPRL
ncbi:hypothetical protein R1sor_003451 [Riccia sorocarpa]|uniref:2-(3-amino-3-carboxypropyl)histidine synthase subunit 1 n=1 Tax=Riccia sorocarpa TaxID=122646 RepID=A0ABD3H7T8_9MARC